VNEAVPVAVWVAAPVKVIPELPPQSPIAVAPVPAAVQVAAPAPVISMKSTTLPRTTAAAVMVAAVPLVPPATKIRLTTDWLLTVNVPDTVIVPVINKSAVLLAAFVRVRSLIVAPVEVTVSELAPANTTPRPFQSAEPKKVPALVLLVQVITAVFAVTVRLVVVVATSDWLLDVSERADEPQVIVRVLLLLVLYATAPIAKLPELNIPKA
jgi:hypothetical protein